MNKPPRLTPDPRGLARQCIECISQCHMSHQSPKRTASRRVLVAVAVVDVDDVDVDVDMDVDVDVDEE